MAGLSDPVFSDAFDDLLQAVTEPSRRLMENVFIDSETSPLESHLVTLGFATGLFVYHYNEYRNSEYEVDVAFQASKAQVLSNPVIQEFVARNFTQAINNKVIKDE